MKDCCIIIPTHKSVLSKIEQIFFEHNINILKNKYDIYLVCPNNLNADYYISVYDKIKIKRFDNFYFSNYIDQSKFRSSSLLYNTFSNYKWILSIETDAILFYDNIQYFIDLDYGYYGAPWPHLNDAVGNSGLCLMKTNTILNIVNSNTNYLGDNADIFLCIKNKNLINACPLDIAKRFSLENDPQKYYDGSFEPMGCHQPWCTDFKYIGFWDNYEPYKKIIHDNGFLTLEETKKKIEIASNLQEKDIIQIVNEAKQNNKIPKIIHFCFFNWKTMPDIYLYFIKTWFEKMPDWTFINWNSNNLKINNILYLKMLKDKKYAFLSDYIRANVVYKYGGFYFDCDVICHNSLNDLLDYDYIFSRECWQEHRDNKLSFECGVFGSKQGNMFLKLISKNYFKGMNNIISPIKYISILKQNNIIIEKIENINEYKQQLDNKNKLFLLNSKYFSNSNIKHDYENSYYFNLIDNQYTSHEFTNSWVFGDNYANRYLSYFL